MTNLTLWQRKLYLQRSSEVFLRWLPSWITVTTEEAGSYVINAHLNLKKYIRIKSFICMIFTLNSFFNMISKIKIFIRKVALKKQTYGAFKCSSGDSNRGNFGSRGEKRVLFEP